MSLGNSKKRLTEKECFIFDNRMMAEGPLTLREMNISDWPDEKEAEGLDVSRIVLPDGLAYDEAPDETIFFKEINPCGIFCTENHPFSTVERFGHWYYCRGQDKEAGIHSSKMQWYFFTKDKDLAVKTAKSHLE